MLTTPRDVNRYRPTIGVLFHRCGANQIGAGVADQEIFERSGDWERGSYFVRDLKNVLQRDIALLKVYEDRILFFPAASRKFGF